MLLKCLAEFCLFTVWYCRNLEDAVKTVKEKAFFMKRALDSDNTKQGIEHAIEMLKELKTNTLNPKNYYELYMKV